MNITDKIFHDDVAARKHLEAQRWPDGPYCPHCGEADDVTRLGGKAGDLGQLVCNSCRKKFTVTVGTIFERSHIPLSKWMLAFRLMASSKKGMSAHQLGRMLGLTYKSAWFMAHRIREAMKETNPGPLGGPGKFVEADETYVGGKAENKHASVRKTIGFHSDVKAPVLSLVERGGNVRSFHVANVTAKTLRPIIVKMVSRKSHLMTDGYIVYRSVGREFEAHSYVDHKHGQYVAYHGGIAHHSNTVENYFSILKRGITGVYHHVSEAHLHRYLSEFDFRYSTRLVSDRERSDAMLAASTGKRLTYRRVGQAA